VALPAARQALERRRRRRARGRLHARLHRGGVQAGGEYHHHWGLYAGATFEPATVEAVNAGRTRVKMLERYPPEINHEGWPRLTRRLAHDAGFALGDIDFIIFTQVRKPSIELVMADLGLPMERTHTIMETLGVHRLGVHPDGFRRRRREGQDQAGHAGRVRRPRRRLQPSGRGVQDGAAGPRSPAGHGRRALEVT
jgi:hypothetical protein